ncbi:hypothetical protein R3P38DRAFT_3194668 [Favolaschia claudopus]|uniref:Uncharacterized protein n=1 Tax=Favolaschia claudopus TaxID=2862362 RepID=A0AAW0BE03_9AGAR
MTNDKDILQLNSTATTHAVPPAAAPATPTTNPTNSNPNVPAAAGSVPSGNRAHRWFKKIISKVPRLRFSRRRGP